MRKPFWLAVLSALLCFDVPRSNAVGLIIVDEIPPDALTEARPFRPIHRFAPLEIRSVKAGVRVRNQVAETKIHQEFYNPSGRRLQGTFYLPLPKGAHLQKFAMEVNGKMTEAELIAADKAKSIYEEIVRKAQDPALLEYIGQELVKVRIFPIEPHSAKTVELAYTQLLQTDGGLTSFVLPLSGAKHCAAPIGILGINVKIETEAGLKSIYSPSHSPEIIRKSDREARLGLELSNVRPEKDFQVFYSTDGKDVGMSLLTFKREGEDGYFMLLATPGLAERKAEPKDVVFVMDTSGSMAGAKIEQGRKALLFCVNSLHEEDRFEVIRFSTEAERLFDRLERASKENVERAEEFVRKFKATGGTAIDDALSAAIRSPAKDSERPCYIVFVTDGRPTLGETKEDAILERAKKSPKGQMRIFCFGVGTDVNAHLLDKIAEETGAVSQYVLPDEDLEVKLSSFFAKISDPVLSNVEIEFEGVRADRMHPGKLPDLFKGQQAVAFGRYAQGGLGCVLLSGTVQGKREEFRFEAEFARKTSENEFIPRLWATRRVGFLLDEIRLRGETGELKDEVTALAREYGIVTPYTSFLVTEEDRPVVAGRPLSEPAPVRREQLVMQRVSRAGAAATADDKSGDAAVAAARYNSRLKEADNELLARLAPAEVRLFGRSGQLSSVTALKDEAAKTVAERYVGSRTFRNEGGAWVELAAQQARDESGGVRIEFNSAEYWKFAAEHPELKEVLALGTDVRFMLGNKLIVVFSKKF